MSSPAFAIIVSKENLDAIMSEAGRKFDRQHLQSWLEEHERGFFVRDEYSPLDCELFADPVFFTMYEFVYPNHETALFKRIKRIEGK